MLTIGDQFPEFELPACVSIDADPDEAFRLVRSVDLKGRYLVVFAWPKTT